MRERIVGVDAGGSATAVALATLAGEVLSIERAGAANLTSAGVPAAAATIGDAIAAASPGEPPIAIFVGAAGAWEDASAQGLTDALRARFPSARIAVGHDGIAALRAAVDGDGIALIAGTGSFAYAQVGSRRVRSGGLGHALGDEGSGYAIGAAALRLTLRALDGRGPRDDLVDAFAERLGTTDAREALAALHARGDVVANVASFAPLVIARASAGDRAAAKIVQAAALDLFELLRGVVKRADVGDAGMPLVLAGGLLRENSMLSFLLETRVTNEFPLLHLIKGAPAPCVGAVALARALLPQ